MKSNSESKWRCPAGCWVGYLKYVNAEYYAKSGAGPFVRFVFEVVLNGKTYLIGHFAPPGMHGDTVLSRMLAQWLGPEVSCRLRSPADFLFLVGEPATLKVEHVSRPGEYAAFVHATEVLAYTEPNKPSPLAPPPIAPVLIRISAFEGEHLWN